MGKYANPLTPAKKEREPTWNFTHGQLHAMSRDSVLKGMAAGTYITNCMYSAAMLMTLHDTLGYGVKRLNMIFQRVQKLFDELVHHEVEYSDLVKALRDECDVNLVVTKPDGVQQDAVDLFAELEGVAKVQMVIGK